MNNDRPPASKLRKWLMGNKESTLPGLSCNVFELVASECTRVSYYYIRVASYTCQLMRLDS